MPSSSQNFEYGPLGPGTGPFRLLVLKKGTGARLEGKLIHTTVLKASNRYEAVSYTWGDPKIQDFIYIGGKQLRITYNLSLTLRDLRQPDIDRLLWNDATCIDQGNDVERGQQVQQMGDIYRHARRVLFCIARPTELNDLLLDVVNRFHGELASANLELSSYQVQKPPSDEIGYPLENKLIEERWNILVSALEGEHFIDRKRLLLAFQEIHAESWFRRVWIVQEVYKAKEGLVYCGRKSAPATVFAACAIFMRYSDKDRPFLRMIGPIHSLMLKPDPILRYSLHELLGKFASSEATNEYDKVYALLGMASDKGFLNSASLQPDYTIGVTEVMERTLRHICGSNFEFKNGSPPYMTIHQFVNDISDSPHNLLFWAAGCGYEPLVRMCLDKQQNEKGGPSLNVIMRGGMIQEVLYLACSKGHKAVVELMLNNYKVVSALSPMNYNNAAGAAFKAGHHHVVALIVATQLSKGMPQYGTTSQEISSGGPSMLMFQLWGRGEGGYI
ncbi:HET domain-containing protein [Microdochium nivale]|nr:HET domain-containing protein [Microdochium nivale]